MTTSVYLGRRDKCTCANKTIHYRPSTDNWKYAVKRIKKEMFSSTGVGLPAPDNYLTEYDGASTPSEKCDYCKNHGSNFDFNSDPFYCKDVFVYRRQRSEHLLFRLTHILGPMQANVLRIYHGVFVAQHLKPKEQPPTPSPYSSQQQQQFDLLEAFLNNDAQFTLPDATQENFDSIFTFDYNNVPQLISNDALETPPPTTISSSSSSSSPPSSSFIPYSYTVGARYTNPGAESPIKPNQTRYGLIPFAPEVPLSFVSMTDKKDKVDDPELLLWYERLAMDTSDHELYGRYVNSSPEWETARLDILEGTILCDISSEDAYFITTLGNSWAAREGFIVE
ncbi:unnamed protein product [Absidia cylindrospora]